jgi:hypothetical protein
MTMPAVSLIASAFQSARFLPLWMRSLEEQTIWSDCELIVIANAPDEEEARLLSAFAERHRQVTVIEVDREPISRSLNRGVAASHAPLIGMANVDDLRSRDGLEAQVRAMELSEEALFCYGPYSVSRSFPPPRQPVRTISPPPYEREEFTRSMHLGPFYVWRRTGRPETTFFDEQLKVGADFDLAIRLALYGPGVTTDVSLGAYFYGPAGLSTGGSLQPVERAVLELRYGVYDKIDYSQVPRAAEYVIPAILTPGEVWMPMDQIVPDYGDFLRARRERWAPRGPLGCILLTARQHGQHALARLRGSAI